MFPLPFATILESELRWHELTNLSNLIGRSFEVNVADVKHFGMQSGLKRIFPSFIHFHRPEASLSIKLYGSTSKIFASSRVFGCIRRTLLAGARAKWNEPLNVSYFASDRLAKCTTDEHGC